MLKKVKFIYNPLAGEAMVTACLDQIVALYQKNGYSLIPYRLTFEGESYRQDIVEGLDDSFHHILIAGGDGTLNFMVNLLQNSGIDIPIAILPVGTANDFGRFVGMPNDVMKGCRTILRGKTTAIDLGLANGRYFTNLLACGLFTEVSYKTPTLVKNTFGRMAYFFGGLSELPKFRRLHIDITSDGGNYRGSCLMLLVFNGQTAGQLRIAHTAELDDGLLDVVILKGEKTIVALTQALTHIRVGRSLLARYNISLDEIVHFKCSRLSVAGYKGSEEQPTDVDGQEGPLFPLEIECAPHRQRIILPAADFKK